MGENPPACAPWITSRPIISGLIPYFVAKPRAIGATIATAPGLTAPTAVSTPSEGGGGTWTNSFQAYQNLDELSFIRDNLQ
jgi:hypothetical protein